MPFFSVQPDALWDAGGRHDRLAGELREVAATLASLTSSAGAAGDPAAARSLADWCQEWAHAVARLAVTADALGCRLDGAAASYVQTDTGVMPIAGNGP